MFTNIKWQSNKAEDELFDMVHWATGLWKEAADKVKEHPERKRGKVNVTD